MAKLLLAVQITTCKTNLYKLKLYKTGCKSILDRSLQHNNVKFYKRVVIIIVIVVCFQLQHVRQSCTRCNKFQALNLTIPCMAFSLTEVQIRSIILIYKLWWNMGQQQSQDVDDTSTGRSCTDQATAPVSPNFPLAGSCRRKQYISTRPCLIITPQQTTIFFIGQCTPNITIHSLLHSAIYNPFITKNFWQSIVFSLAVCQCVASSLTYNIAKNFCTDIQ